MRASEMRKGQTVTIDGKLYAIVDYQHVKLGKGGAVYQTKLKSLIDGTIQNIRLRAEENIEEAYLDKRTYEYLYSTGNEHILMDTTNYDQNNLLRSAMESAIYGLRTGLDAFRAQGCQVGQLRLTGGGAGSAGWRQMVADIFALPVTVQVTDEGAALGAALQALWMHEGKDSGSSMQDFLDSHLALDDSRACDVDSERSEVYAQFYADYLRHVEVVSPLYS